MRRNSRSNERMVTDTEIYAYLRKSHPNFPVGFNFTVALNMMVEAGRLIKEAESKPRLRIVK